jgi:hypothetical protein
MSVPMMRFSLCAVIFLSVVSSCWSQTPDFSWLKGTWKLDGKNVYEIWSGEGNNLMGKSFKVVGSDTVLHEKMALRREGDDYFYVPDVAENKGEVKFRMTTITSDGFIAENQHHDFPKVIRYTIARKEQTMNATIEGNGKLIQYTFHRFR